MLLRSIVVVQYLSPVAMLAVAVLLLLLLFRTVVALLVMAAMAVLVSDAIATPELLVSRVVVRCRRIDIMLVVAVLLVSLLVLTVSTLPGASPQSRMTARRRCAARSSSRRF